MVYIQLVSIDIGTMRNRMGITWLMQMEILFLTYMRRLPQFRYLASAGEEELT